MPLFSVVIPTYARGSFLADAVSSVQAQTITDWECIVAVDGGSEVPEFDDPRVRVVVRETNGGAGAARNTGVEHSSGDHLAFLDDDDTWLPNRLELASEGLLRAPVAVCFGLSGSRVSWQGAWNGNVHDTILDSKAPSVDGIAVRRDVWVPFDERFRGAEDVEWLLRISRNADFATVPTPGFVRGNAGTGRPDAVPRLDGVRLLFDLHADYFAHHKAAAARCWTYFGEASMAAGRFGDSRKAFLRSFLAQPSRRSLAAWRRSWIDPGRAQRPVTN